METFLAWEIEAFTTNWSTRKCLKGSLPQPEFTQENINLWKFQSPRPNISIPESIKSLEDALKGLTSRLGRSGYWSLITKWSFQREHDVTDLEEDQDHKKKSRCKQMIVLFIYFFPDLINRSEIGETLDYRSKFPGTKPAMFTLTVWHLLSRIRSETIPPAKRR